ncbi:cytochrome C oxidase subunit IV family protein [Membranihabitans marinus]|uniref:cytochrome C oxidase subunit IV family protein n=1 Tax=Membranihabitans marinus TaxID=1227546 RepID=UPI001F38E95F|nr:cytochrome C oxidase subunit IV family protein [Membranihabitans marinus]
MAHQSYEAQKKAVYKGLVFLAIITLIEVVFSLFGKGHIIWEGAAHSVVVKYVVGLIIIGLSLYKAFFIIFEFMHMSHEKKTLARSVLLPMCLLIWAVIAFLYEGNYWNNSRSYILAKDHEKTERVMPELPVKEDVKQVGHH